MDNAESVVLTQPLLRIRLAIIERFDLEGKNAQQKTGMSSALIR
jgi:hypothetical protein